MGSIDSCEQLLIALHRVDKHSRLGFKTQFHLVIGGVVNRALYAFDQPLPNFVLLGTITNDAGPKRNAVASQSFRDVNRSAQELDSPCSIPCRWADERWL